MLPPDPAFIAAFTAHVAPLDEHNHRRWTSTLTDDGYGLFTWPGPNGRRIKYRAHRVALTIAAGPPPPDRPWALHLPRCSQRWCVSEHHLYWGTPAENSADRDQPQRQLELRAARDQRNGQLRLL